MARFRPEIRQQRPIPRRLRRQPWHRRPYHRPLTTPSPPSPTAAPGSQLARPHSPRLLPTVPSSCTTAAISNSPPPAWPNSLTPEIFSRSSSPQSIPTSSCSASRLPPASSSPSIPSTCARASTASLDSSFGARWRGYCVVKSEHWRLIARTDVLLFPRERLQIDLQSYIGRVAKER